VARAKPVLAVKLEGPFFTRDPRKTFRQNIRSYMDKVAEVAEADVQARLTGSREADVTRAEVQGRTSSLAGKRWAVTARVSVSAAGYTRAEAIRVKAIAAGRKRGIHGTTRGAEGRTHAFSRGRRAALAAARDNAHLLVEDLN
jgi:hypothetical protein